MHNYNFCNLIIIANWQKNACKCRIINTCRRIILIGRGNVCEFEPIAAAANAADLIAVDRVPHRARRRETLRFPSSQAAGLPGDIGRYTDYAAIVMDGNLVHLGHLLSVTLYTMPHIRKMSCGNQNVCNPCHPRLYQ